MEDFKSQLLSGVFWTSIQTVVNRVFKFIIKLVLARLLFPEDYGIIGMAVVFTSIVSAFNELGMGAALIQRKKEFLTNSHYNTAFWAGLIWGILIFTFMVFVISPLAAWFYEEPILSQIIPVLSLGILATPVNVIHRSQLTRDMNFKKISFISNTSNIFSGVVALILALNGAGVWSLVFNSIASFIIAMPQWFYATKWFPNFEFSKQAFRDIFGFGIYTTGTRLLVKINGQIDYMIVGKLLGAVSLGIYSLAFLLTSIFRSQITQIIDQVLYPLFSKMQDDTQQLKRYYLKIVRINAMAVYPVMFGLILFSTQFISLLFGEKWTEAIPILKILSVAVILGMLTTSSSVLLRASGKPAIELKIMTFNTLVFYAPFIILGTYLYEVTGTAVGYVIATFFSVIVVMRKLFIEFKIHPLEVLNVIKIPFSVSFFPFLIVGIMLLLKVHWVISMMGYILLFILGAYFFAKEEVKLLRDIFEKTRLRFKKTN